MWVRMPMTKENIALPLRVVFKVYDCPDGNRFFAGHVEDANGRQVVRRDSCLGACRCGWDEAQAECETSLREIAEMIESGARNYKENKEKRKGSPR